MQDTIILEAKPREAAGRQVRALRKTGFIPAVLYGHNVPSQSLAVDSKIFEKVYKQAGESTLVDLVVGSGAPVKVLIQEVAKHHLTLKPIHVDFYQVKMTEKLTADIPLKFTGEAPAIKEFGAVLIKNLQEVKVECLPQDLVHEIEIDLSVLKALGDAITVAQVVVPSGIRILNKPEETVVLAQAPRAEEEEVAAMPPSEKEAIEGIKVMAEEKKAEKEKDKEEKAKEEKKA